MGKNYAFFGNLKGSEILAIDIDSMSFESAIPCGREPYAVDKAGDDHLFSITRKIQAVDKIGFPALVNEGTVALQHSPRTAKVDSAGKRVLISGADKSFSTILSIPSFAEILLAGSGLSGDIEDYGGGNKSGHESWLFDQKRFFLLDRVQRKVFVYGENKNNPLWSLNTPTTPHHVLQDNKCPSRYYIACEGNPKALLPPSLFILDASSNAVAVLEHTFLPIPRHRYPEMGGHHVDQTPDGAFLFMGSAEGHCYILSTKDLSHVKTLVTGKGHGHTGFATLGTEQVGITVNHKDSFVSLINLSDFSIRGNIQVATAPATSGLSQGHTTGIQGNKFYMMVPHEARFLEINLETQKIERELVLDEKVTQLKNVYAVQGTFVWSKDRSGAVCTNCD